MRLDLGGLPVTVDDTAGLRLAPGDEIESEGMKRSAASWTAADVPAPPPYCCPYPCPYCTLTPPPSLLLPLPVSLLYTHSLPS